MTRWAAVGIALALVGVEVWWPVPGHLPPGTFAAAGGLGALLLAGLAKALGRAGLETPEHD